MKNLKDIRSGVVTELHWLIDEPTNSPTAKLTCYREKRGLDDLFSVFVKFESPKGLNGVWQIAKIFTPVKEMEPRLFSGDEQLILTAGIIPVAVAKVLSECSEPI
ncbi:hypothetical protein [Paracidovorax valerianellae]|uniref:hypothetical protein n=1 Tax=Paracidovorax valerianellae TaxID=187868 RepID=UPI001113ACCE|nr:hypothetical protein [Paracidovorax valerianellae]MDA8444386.1 hypothetical protein [Paracidovorax valerianellae]